jgi:uridine monophosphate synthetase
VPKLNGQHKVELAVDLFSIGALKFGNFTLRSGKKSPVYVDLRALASYPHVLTKIAEWLRSASIALDFQRVAGLPYAGIPLAVAMAVAGDPSRYHTPALYSRKEAKEYGTKKLIEGDYNAGDRVLLLDDVITDGGAKIDLVKPYRDAGLTVTDVLVVIDREQGGAEKLKEVGLQLHSLATLRELTIGLQLAGKWSTEQLRTVTSYLDNPDGYTEP